MIPLICLDVDGTLVGSTGRISAEVWAAADAAVRRGQHLALSTARGAFGASWAMAQRIDPDGWHVFHAGGAVVQSRTAAVRAHAIDPDVVDQAEQIARSNRWVIELYTATDYAVDSEHPLAVDHAGLIGVPFTRRSRHHLDGDAIVRIQYVVPDADVQTVADATAQMDVMITSATSPIMPGATFVSATKAGVDKGTGIATIAGELGIDMSDVMMVGDGHNDLPALEVVGHPVAMGNAIDAVRRVAAHVVAPVEDDGVVEALELSVRL